MNSIALLRRIRISIRVMGMHSLAKSKGMVYELRRRAPDPNHCSTYIIYHKPASVVVVVPAAVISAKGESWG